MTQYGILLVSHVPEIVAGVKKLLQQVAQDVPITTAGGTSEHDIGTSLEKITAAIEENAGEELLVFYDLGSAKMNLELAAEFTTKPLHLYDTAFVESAYAAAALLQVEVPLTQIEADLTPLKVK